MKVVMNIYCRKERGKGGERAEGRERERERERELYNLFIFISGKWTQELLYVSNLL